MRAGRPAPAQELSKLCVFGRTGCRRYAENACLSHIELAYWFVICLLQYTRSTAAHMRARASQNFRWQASLTAISGAGYLRLLSCALLVLATLAAAPRLANLYGAAAYTVDVTPINHGVVVHGLDVSLQGRNRALTVNIPTLQASQPDVGLCAYVVDVAIPGTSCCHNIAPLDNRPRGIPRCGHARDPPIMS